MMKIPDCQFSGINWVACSLQLFIFYTISEFGAIVFVIISTLRQAMAILLSCLIYGHPVTPVGVLGVCTVFGAIYLKVYCGQRMKRIKKESTDSNIAKA